MKRFVLGTLGAVLLASTIAFAATNGDDVMRKQKDGTYVVNTTSLCPNVKGFKGTTPLEVHIKGNKIVKVVALPNHETPRYFNKAKDGLFSKWNGMSVSKAAKTDVDGVTGATFSSRALKANVKAAVDYYKKHK